MATYVNDLRLKEITTGDESGTWGTSTNTNLELIAEAFSYGTEAITTNADTHLTTIADGQSDEGRSLYLKYTGTLDSACTITLGPNTVSKLWFIENATSGSQNIIISQGSGANVTIPNGDVKVIYSDGAGSGAAIVDAFTDLNLGGTTTVAALDAGSGAITTTGTVTGGTLAGTLSTAAQPNITSLGTLTGLTSSAAIVSTSNSNSFGGTVFTSAITGTTASMSGSITISGNSNTFGSSTITGNLSVDGGTIKLDGNYPVGTNNVALGDTALDSASLSGGNNTAIGNAALSANTTGGDNVAVGRNALDANTTGVNNVAIGESALSTATTASGNTAIGKDALAIATGGENTVVGKKAGDAIQAHVRNTIMGDTAGGAVNSSDNTFIGQNSGSAITTGDANTILGRYSGNEGGLDLRTSSNNIVLSDGDGNPQFFITSDGKTNINSVDTTPRGILNVQGAVSNTVTTVMSFGDMGQRGAGTAQAIDFVMGRTGFISEDACASIRGVCEGASSTSVSHNIGLEFWGGAGTTQYKILKLRSAGGLMQLNSDEVPTYGNPYVAGAFVMGPTQAGGNINGGLTNSTALVNRGGELYATDSSLNSTQLTPHNWELISDGPSEELAWTYWSQRPSPENKDIMQGINVDMAKVVRGVEDLIGEKLIYTENSNMDDHTHQNIIADIQSTLADLTTRIEALEA